MSKGRILYLADASSIHVQRWANHFVDRGWEVGMASYSNAGAGQLDPRVKAFKLFRVPKMENYFESLKRSIRVRQIKKIISSFKPSVVHAVSTRKWGVYAHLAGFKPTILTEWGLYVTLTEEERRWMTPEAKPHTPSGRAMWKNAALSADALHVDSGYLADRMVKAFDVSKGAITVIPWGVDLRKFNPGLDVGGLREKHGFGSAPIVASTRSFEPVYDLETLVYAAPLVRREVSDAMFLLKGSGSQEAKLKKQVEDLALSHAIKFIGFVEYDEMPIYTALGDVYVSTALSDASSVSLQEALACGKPVVVSDAPSNDEWVSNGKNGFIFKRKDPKELARYIVTMLNDKRLREEMGHSSREIAEQKANQEHSLLRLEKMYLDAGKR